MINHESQFDSVDQKNHEKITGFWACKITIEAKDCDSLPLVFCAGQSKVWALAAIR